MSEIKRFHVRDGYVLDEHPHGSVVRYDAHCEVVAALEANIEEYKQMHYHDRQKIKRLEADRDMFERFLKRSHLVVKWNRFRALEEGGGK